MKSQKIYISILFVLLFLTNNIKAQIYPIDSLSIIPTYPTTADSVKIICSAYFPSGSCALSNSSITITANTISVDAIHILGPLTYICHSIDTITIGKLENGNYELYYHIYDPQNSFVNIIDTISFTVYNQIGVYAYEKSENDIRIYPNPSTTEIFIELKTIPIKKLKIEIFTIFGQNLKTINDINEKTAIDIHSLTEGIYYVVITDQNKHKWTKKFFKSTL
jgi:hypothetical protein